MAAPRALPPGFEALREGRLQMAVAGDLRERLVPLLRDWSRGTLPPGRPLTGGRGGIAAYELRDGLAVVLRPCHRGGWVARFNHELYCGWRPRPFEEIRVVEALRLCAVPTVEVLAAAVSWIIPGCYRGAVMTREVRGACNLWEALQRTDANRRANLCAAAAAATRRLHDAGAVHPDLNLQNYLIRREGAAVEALIIDCDRVRFTAVTPRDRRAAFARLCRSVRRLDPTATVITLACVEALRTIQSAG